jgi:hypothetical protein
MVLVMLVAVDQVEIVVVDQAVVQAVLLVRLTQVVAVVAVLQDLLEVVVGQELLLFNITHKR